MHARGCWDTLCQFPEPHQRRVRPRLKCRGVLWSRGHRAASLCPGLGLPHSRVTSLRSRAGSLHDCHTHYGEVVGDGGSQICQSLPLVPTSLMACTGSGHADAHMNTCTGVHTCVCTCIKPVTDSSRCVSRRVCTGVVVSRGVHVCRREWGPHS